MDQIILVEDSYLTMPYGTHAYDYVISAMSLHHLLQDTKRNFYMKIHAALKTGGTYIEGDSVTTTKMEHQFLEEFHESLMLVTALAHDYLLHTEFPGNFRMPDSNPGKLDIIVEHAVIHTIISRYFR